VSEALAPCFELFWGAAEALAQLCEGYEMSVDWRRLG
jgi:hypothetical protein